MPIEQEIIKNVFIGRIQDLWCSVDRKKTGFDSLPAEIQLDIIECLLPHQRINFAYTSKSCLDIVQRSTVYTPLPLQNNYGKVKWLAERSGRVSAERQETISSAGYPKKWLDELNLYLVQGDNYVEGGNFSDLVQRFFLRVPLFLRNDNGRKIDWLAERSQRLDPHTKKAIDLGLLPEFNFFAYSGTLIKKKYLDIACKYLLQADKCAKEGDIKIAMLNLDKAMPIFESVEDFESSYSTQREEFSCRLKISPDRVILESQFRKETEDPFSYFNNIWLKNGPAPQKVAKVAAGVCAGLVVSCSCVSFLFAIQMTMGGMVMGYGIPRNTPKAVDLFLASWVVVLIQAAGTPVVKTAKGMLLGASERQPSPATSTSALALWMSRLRLAKSSYVGILMRDFAHAATVGAMGATVARARGENCAQSQLELGVICGVGAVSLSLLSHGLKSAYRNVRRVKRD